MDRPPRDIPGYYYDKQKRKYFKIQSGSPASSAYSSQDVKRRKLGEEKAEARAFAIVRQQGRIRKSKILEEPLAGGVLAREQGKIVTLRAPEAFSRGLVAQGNLLLSSSLRSQDSQFVIGPGADQQSLRIIVVIPTCIAQLNVNAGNYASYTMTNTGGYSANSVVRSMHLMTPTSISINHSSRMVAITSLTESSDLGIVILPHADPGEGPTGSLSIGPGEARGSGVSVYSSAAAPPGSNFVFAYGTSHGILCTDKASLDTHWIGSAPAAESYHPKDVFALEFLADRPAVLLSGGRKGLLDIQDTRIRIDPLCRHVIEHPSSITHIKQLDPHRIIVSGLNSSLCQYDLRFTKNTPPPIAPLPHARGRPKSPANSSPTRPILQYPDYYNTATILTGFDVDVNAGIVAAAQEWDEHHAPVQLFSLHGGHAVHSPQLARHVPPRPNPGAAHVKCVRLASDIEDRMKSLYIGHGPSIRRFAWADEEDEEAGERSWS